MHFCEVTNGFHKSVFAVNDFCEITNSPLLTSSTHSGACLGQLDVHRADRSATAGGNVVMAAVKY